MTFKRKQKLANCGGELKLTRASTGLFSSAFLFIFVVLFLACWVFVAERGLSLVVMSRFLIVVASLVAEHGF